MMRSYKVEAEQLAADFGARDVADLVAEANALRVAGHGETITYSRKVFVPLTKLCRDTCRYCTFAQSPREGQRAYLTVDEAVAIAAAGRDAGCREALLTLGDQPELRWQQARDELDAMGFATTLEYLGHVAAEIRQQTGLLPHLNPGLMSDADFAALRPVSPSMGIMLEGIAPRLAERGGPHFGCPDKEPARRLETIAAAGRARVPFTSGLLIGIGESRAERVEALLELRALNREYDHLQEIIIQPFRAKADTKMADAAEPDDDELLWTLAVTRILFGADANIQSPPNLAPAMLEAMVEAGINDLGGISPVTLDHVNPEAPWPEITSLARRLAETGRTLAERLTIYPAYARRAGDWVDPKLAGAVLAAIDGQGRPREDDWLTGQSTHIPAWAEKRTPLLAASDPVQSAIRRAETGEELREAEIASLFAARGDDFHAVCAAADRMRAELVGDDVTYVITRNINYTNLCTHGCGFCAFSKGRVSEETREAPYNLSAEVVRSRVAEAWARGGTEVCMQGGIHPSYTGETYLGIVAAAKAAAPDIHVHAFSPLEITSGARSLGASVEDYLRELKAAGLASLPGTAAEVLDDEVRAVICADKLTTDEWLDVVRTAHRVGIPTTSTIMFGHVDRYDHWARHLLRLRALQCETGGLTEFVPLPFVASEAPIYRKGRARRGPTFRESVLMHAVARLSFGALLPNIQTSWVKMGLAGGQYCLGAGANDFGGTLMNESITRSAGASHGQEMTVETFERAIVEIGRTPRQRTTLYGSVDHLRREGQLESQTV
ncbi:MAG: 5-amino-6-(D-ribitylamino)uracil--L-tyrosine 4-hydroxyphenyl transferase CofH [Novosphingobium sp.]|nr:5-amino-6-(D-ribitylamino)uracil--L-tyrosine 4-hydroxyphenyl transferase CofH [Novosphingobium sp.]